jgi:cytochrome c peroxidase
MFTLHKMLKPYCLFLILLLPFFAFFCKSKNALSNDSVINKAEIGRVLFFDNKLSKNKTKSCASCHNPNLYFTDGYKKALGIYADIQMRNTPSIINSNDFEALNWASPTLKSFEQQMEFPLFNNVHLEMGMVNDAMVAKDVLDDLKYEKYKISDDDKNWEYIKSSLSAYQKKIISRNSKFDFYLKDSINYSLSYEEKQGMNLFYSKKINCIGCHGNIDFNKKKDGGFLANNLLYSTKEYFRSIDKGVFNESKESKDIGIFRIPSLRNVMKTPPYMHDGSIDNMTQVLNHYNKDKIMSTTDQKAIIAFLETLTDTTILTNNFFKSLN